MIAATTTLERVLHADVVDTRDCVPLLIVGAGIHGCVLGALSGEPWMAVFSAIKVPALLLISTLVTLPCFYVLHGALGLHDAFARAIRSVIAAQTALAILLAGTAPILLVVAASTADGYWITVLDGGLFALGVAVGQVVLTRHYRPLLAEDWRHRITLWSWALLYAFFGIQFAWTLRPFLGTPGFPVEFLRAEAFEQNAYVVLIEHLRRLVG